jgi:hypothetical protein
VSINLSDTTPTAPAGTTNVHWQQDASGNVSANAALPAFTWGFYAPGTYTANQLIVAYTFTRAVTFPANWGAGGSNPPSGKVDVNPTGSAVLTVKKNGITTVGTATISTSGVYTFATSGGTTVSFVNGDDIEVYAPASADATLAGARFTIQGQ